MHHLLGNILQGLHLVCGRAACGPPPLPGLPRPSSPWFSLLAPTRHALDSTPLIFWGFSDCTAPPPACPAVPPWAQTAPGRSPQSVAQLPPHQSSIHGLSASGCCHRDAKSWRVSQWNRSWGLVSPLTLEKGHPFHRGPRKNPLGVQIADMRKGPEEADLSNMRLIMCIRGERSL